MNDKASNPAQAFLAGQRRRLLELKAQLERTIQNGRAREADLMGQPPPEAQEYEDDAQRLALLEVDGTLIASEMEQLDQVNRALEKIDEGTYGVADRTGASIPRDRLIAMPQAPDALSEHDD